METNDNKRIAKNTMALYFRMLFLMVVSLYTNRVVLAELGEEDFGIYSAVGGIVPMLLFITHAIASATQRFLNVELGKGGDLLSLRRVFATTCLINLVLTGFIVLLCETFGYWFVNYEMNFRPERAMAVNWVLQCSVINCIPGIIFASYLSSIITHEHMGVFAGLSLLEAAIKLAFVLALPFIPCYKLEFYAVMTLTLSIVLGSFYFFYSRRHFEETRHVELRLATRQSVLGVLKFTSWTVLGVLDTIVHIQGIAMVVNIYFGMVVNAAYGIAAQVNSVVKRFVQSFLTAFNPHVVKSYAAGQREEMHTYILRGCRIALILVSVIVIPLTIETEGILSLWLKEVPRYTAVLVRFALIATLLDSSTELLTAAMGATGRIKWYHIVVTSVGLLHLLLTWLLFWLGFPPYWSMYVYIAVMVVMQACRFGFNVRDIGLPLGDVLRQYVLRGICFVCVSLPLPILVHHYAGADSRLFALMNCLLAVLCVLAAGYALMLFPSERKGISSLIASKLRKLHH